MDIKHVFRMPTPVTIAGRSSSITNSFVNGIVPCIVPHEQELREVLNILGMSEHNVRCSYCGDKHTEWDHFRPLIQNKRPTGFISEIHNLVPSCGKCNQSKGNSNWKEWILSSAKLSPKTRNIDNLNQIILRLERFEMWSKPTRVNFESIVGKDIWKKHWENCERLHNMMYESQKLSDEIKMRVAETIQTPSMNMFFTSYLKDLNEINIKGAFSTEKKVSVIVQSRMFEILLSKKIPIEKINLLQTLKYSNEIFKLHFPLLKEVDHTKDLDPQKKDDKGRNRYYKQPITIYGKSYLLCSQWYESNRPYLMKWIELNE